MKNYSGFAAELSIYFYSNYFLGSIVHKNIYPLSSVRIYGEEERLILSLIIFKILPGIFVYYILSLRR